jgi:AraC-like DNA-binding protein
MIGTPRRPLLALGRESVRLASMTDASYAPQPLVDWDEMGQWLGDLPPAAVLLVDVLPAREYDPPMPLARLLARRRSLAVVAVARPASAAQLRELYDAGVSEVVDLDLDTTPDALRFRLRQAHARPLKRRLEGALAPYASTDARTLLRAACEVAADGGDTVDLAAALGAAPETLAGWCRRAAVPGPRRLMVWMRLLLAGLLLEDEGRTIAGVAAACGYATDRSLRRAFEHAMGTDPSSVRGRGAFDAVAAAFNAALRTLREERPATRR